MSGEIIAILGVGVALAGLILTSVRGLRAEIAGLRVEIRWAARGDRGDSGRGGSTARAHGAPRRLARRLARSHYLPRGSQLNGRPWLR